MDEKQYPIRQEDSPRHSEDIGGIYEGMILPDEWRKTVEPAALIQNWMDADESVARVSSRGKWVDPILHVLCWVVLIAVLLIHDWSLFKVFILPSEPIAMEKITEAPSPIIVTGSKSSLEIKIAAVNRAMAEKRWKQAETLLGGILDSDSMRKQLPETRLLELLYASVTVGVLVGDYDGVWAHYIQINRSASRSRTAIPYEILAAVCISRYEIAAHGSLGGGMSRDYAEVILRIMDRIRDDYGDSVYDDERLLVIEADALLSSLGGDLELFDLGDRAEVARWERFESVMGLLNAEGGRYREVLRMNYRKWRKVDGFFWIPLKNERVVIGKYVYDEAMVKRSLSLIESQLMATEPAP